MPARRPSSRSQPRSAAAPPPPPPAPGSRRRSAVRPAEEPDTEVMVPKHMWGALMGLLALFGLYVVNGRVQRQNTNATEGATEGATSSKETLAGSLTNSLKELRERHEGETELVGRIRKQLEDFQTNLKAQTNAVVKTTKKENTAAAQAEQAAEAMTAAQQQLQAATRELTQLSGSQEEDLEALTNLYDSAKGGMTSENLDTALTYVAGWGTRQKAQMERLLAAAEQEAKAAATAHTNAETAAATAAAAQKPE